MVKPDDMLLDDQSVRQTLHEKIDRMRGDRLTLLNQVVLQLEADQLAGELDKAFDQDRQQLALTKEKILQAVARHREEHPYHS